MTGFEKRPERAFGLAVVALIIAVLCGVMAWYYHTRDTANIAKARADAAQSQVTEERKTLCGGFVPISKITPPPHTSPIGLELLQWAKDSAAHLHCPANSKP